MGKEKSKRHLNLHNVCKNLLT